MSRAWLAGALAAACPLKAHGRWNDCVLTDVIQPPAAAGTDFSDFWGSFVKNESRLSLDTGAEMTSARFFMGWTLAFTQSAEVLNGIVGNCLFGFLTVLLHALPMLDYQRGREDALAMLDTAQAVWSSASTMDGFAAVTEEAKQLGWDVPAISATLELYSGMLRWQRREGCDGLKFYVYPLPGDGSPFAAPPRELLRSGPSQYLRALLQAPLQCLFGMYGTELLFHRLFSQPGCRVDEPEDAELFFVPSYFKCVEVLNYADPFNEREDEAALLFEQTLSLVKSAGPWFERHDGADHVVLFSWGRFPCKLPRWREALRSAVALQVEDHCEDLNSEEPQPTFSRWKDIIIPGHIDQWRVLELQRRNRPSGQRGVLVAFHGRTAENAASYANVTVRSLILEMAGLPGVSVGGFVEGYHELLGSSIFCLAPRGITPWTIHLYVALLAGCIPVILSDRLELPFQDRLDWPSFSVRWPEEAVGIELYRHLLAIPVQVIEEMKRKVDEHACWFNYYSTDSGCSPGSAVLHALRARVRQRPKYAGRRWPSPATVGEVK